MTKTYDISKVSVVLGAEYLDFEEVNIKYDSPRFVKKEGARGGSARAKNASKVGTCRLIVSQESDTNDYLMSLYLQGLTYTFLMRDALGTAVAQADGYIFDIPELSHGKDLKDREWTIALDNLDLFVGGNFETKKG